MTKLANRLALADWRRQVAEMYAAVRHHLNPEAAWHEYRTRRDYLFATHPQSPLTEAQRAAFEGLPYSPYNPAWRIAGNINFKVEPETLHINLPEDGEFSYTRVARVHFTVQGLEHALSLFWIEGYGGGLFLPFRDQSNGQASYGGGRYLYDTIKGADLNVVSDEFILDFNFAYNPSCAYNPQWVCPLSPPENRLPIVIDAGEIAFLLDGEA